MAFTGAVERIGSADNFGSDSSFIFPNALAWTGTTLYLFGNSKLYTINRQTGVATEIGDTRISSDTTDSVHGATYLRGTLYASVGFFPTLYRVVTSSGLLFRVGGFLPLSGRNFFTTLFNDGSSLYGIDSSNRDLRRIISTGSSTRLVSDLGVSSIRGAAFHKGVLYIGAGNTLYSYDISTKTLTTIGNLNAGLTVYSMDSDGTDLFCCVLHNTGSGSISYLAKFVDVQPVPPTFSSQFPTNQNLNEGGSYSRDVSSHFTGRPTFTLGTITPASPALGATITSAGVLSVATAPEVSQDTIYTIPVIATNSFGTITQNFSLQINHVPAPVISDAQLSISSNPSRVRVGGMVMVTFTFNKAVQGFTADDITITGGTKGAFTQNGNVYTLIITAPTSGAGSIQVSVDEDVVTEGNNAASATFQYFTPVPITPDDTTSALAFTNKPAIYRVDVDGLDISESVSSINGLSQQLDITVPTSFQTSDCVLTLNDPDNTLDIKFNQVIRVRAGFINQVGDDVLDDIFIGKVLNTRELSKSKQIVVRVSDDSQRLRNQNIENFGFRKNLVLEQGATRGVNASYPFPEVLAPVSEGSLVADGLTERDRLNTEGDLDPTNVKLTPQALQTEGGALDENPAITVKSPYRWRRIEQAVSDIVSHYDIEDTDIQIDDQEFDENYMSTVGRPGYFVEGDKAETWRWRGNITGIVNAGNDKFYMLYSSREETTLPRILEYDKETDNWTSIYQHTSHAEFWKILFLNNNLYVLGTKKSSGIREHVIGAYDPTEITPSTTMWIYNLSNDTLSEYVQSDNALPVALGMYYHVGFFGGVNERIGIQADNRKGFEVHNGEIYYCYADGNSHGVAKATAQNTTEKVISVARDKAFSHLGGDFSIAGSKLYFKFASMSGSGSTFKVVEIDI